MEGITRYLEETLGLPVNGEKSEVALMREVTFLGFRIFRLKIRVGEQSIAKFKRRIQEFKTLFGSLDDWVRGRLRSMRLAKLSS
jgi:RNA-directed DNA polymerase